MSKLRTASGAVIQHGQMIVPGAKPNSLAKDSPLHPRAGKQKNFQVADREHGFDKHDLALKIPGASQGKHHHPDPSSSGVPIHGGMHFREGGKFNAGISRTQANSPTDDEKFAAGFAHRKDDIVPDVLGEYRTTPGIHGLNGSLPAKIKK